MRLYDASVLVAAFSREQASAQAVALLTVDPEPLVNELGLAETRVSPIRKRKRGEMTAGAVRRALMELDRSLAEGSLRLIPHPASLWDERR